MKVCVLGGLGSIGSRYVAILRHLKHEALVCDLGDPFPDAEKYIIATPTDTHIEWCKRLIDLGKPFLCEKPFSKDVDECRSLENYDQGWVVCQYKLLFDSVWGGHIKYDYFRTGKDGLNWDVCQMTYLDPECEIGTTSPVWTLKIGDNAIPYKWMEEAYVDMVRMFVKGDTKSLWTLEDGRKMTEAVLCRS